MAATEISKSQHVIARGTKYLAYGFNDYLYSGLALGMAAQGATPPDLTQFRDSIDLFSFAGTGVTVEEAFFTIHLLHDLRPGKDITFHIHWSHNNATPSGDVKWQIDYSVARGYGVDIYPAPITLTAVQAVTAQYTHHMTDDDDMIIPWSNTLEPDAIIIGRIYRDPADVEDTFEDDAFLIHFDIHYQQSSLGSHERNRPWTSIGFAT